MSKAMVAVEYGLPQNRRFCRGRKCACCLGFGTVRPEEAASNEEWSTRGHFCGADRARWSGFQRT